jgi:hypothetical protein
VASPGCCAKAGAVGAKAISTAKNKAKETRQNLPIILSYPLRTVFRFSSSGVQNGLRELSILNVRRDGYVSTIFPVLAELAAAFLSEL